MGIIIGKGKTNRTGRYVSLAWFKAYDREMSEFWMDETKPLIEQIELRCIDICNTLVFHEIQIIDTLDPTNKTTHEYKLPA